MDNLNEESYKDSTLIMQLLRDNLTVSIHTFAARRKCLRMQPAVGNPYVTSTNPKITMCEFFEHDQTTKLCCVFLYLGYAISFSFVVSCTTLLQLIWIGIGQPVWYVRCYIIFSSCGQQTIQTKKVKTQNKRGETDVPEVCLTQNF